MMVMRVIVLHPNFHRPFCLKHMTNFESALMDLVTLTFDLCMRSRVTHVIGFLPATKFARGRESIVDKERQRPASFFASGIQKLVDRWDKCLNELGQYVEK